MHLSGSHHRHTSSLARSNHRHKNYSEYSQSIVEEDRMKSSTSTRRHTPQGKSTDNLYLAKLESKVLELQKKLDTQNYQIQTLTSQTENYMRICEQQKQQISSLNAPMLRQQYEQQINELVAEKQRTTQLIYSLSQEYKQIQQQYDRSLTHTKLKNNQLAAMIQQALSQKQQLLESISQADRHHEQHQLEIQQQQERIDELRLIQRKLVIVLKEMRALQIKMKLYN